MHTKNQRYNHIFSAVVAVSAFALIGCQQAAQTSDSSDQSTVQPSSSQQMSLEIVAPSQQLNDTQMTSSQMMVPAMAEGAPVPLVQKTVSWKGKTFTFSQFCNGTTQHANFEGAPLSNVPFCIGENLLQFSDPTGKTVDIAQDTITDPSKAPLLMDAQGISSTASNLVLISYQAEPCSTTDDCGVGMPTNYVSYVFNLADDNYSALKNFPLDGNAVWNPSGSKALFIPQTCGGAGCGSAGIIGYNLKKDQVTQSVTKDVAAGDSSDPGIIYEDVSGNKLPYWKSVSWVNDTQYNAVIVQKNGVEKTVSGNF